jgi:hypothetical protein
MLTGKFSKVKELVDWFERDHNDEQLAGFTQFWDVDKMLDWCHSDRKILEHPGLPDFMAFWCDSDLWLYAEIASEFASRWPGVQPQFDYLAKTSSFNIDRNCWEIYD